MIELKPLFHALHFTPYGVGCPSRTSAELRAYSHADLVNGGDGCLWSSPFQILVNWDYLTSLWVPHVALDH